MNYDVAIIGGGLAGLTLSIDLQKRGYKIAVIEKGNYPRHKVCGEYISMESHAYLHTICPGLTELNLPLISKFKLTSGNTKEFRTELGLGGFGIGRYLLEELLFIEAQKQGVKFFLDTKAQAILYNPDDQNYTVTSGPVQITASLVCNATGKNSNLKTSFSSTKTTDRTTNTNYVGVKYHIKLQRDPDQIEIHNFPGGYCGISNIEEGKSCLCYIVNSKKLKAVKNSIPDLEKTFLFKNSNLKSIFTNAEFLMKEPITISGINFRIKEPVTDTSLFFGDAAGCIAPIAGNGMSMALRSASVLAKGLDQFFSKKITRKHLELSYSRFWNQEFSARIKLSRHLQKLSEYPFLTKRTIELFNLFPPLAKSTIRQTHGNPF